MVRRHSFSSNRSQFSSVRIGHSSVQFESVTVQFSSNRSQFSSVRIGHSRHGSPVGHSQHNCSREGSRPPGTSARRDGPYKKAAGGVHDPGFVCGHHVTRESPLCHPSGTRRQLGGLRAYNYVSDGSCGASLAAYVRTTESLMVHVAPTWRPTCSHYVVCRQTGARIDRQSHLNYACYYEVDTVQ